MLLSGSRLAAYDFFTSQSTSVSKYLPLLQKVQTQGVLSIIVGFRETFEPEGLLTQQAIQFQRHAIGQTRSRILRTLATHRATVLSHSDNWIIPYVALNVDQETLGYLISSPEVSSIEENVNLSFSDVQSNIGIIGANTAWSMGYAGSGQAIAILDTGVDENHPDFEGRVVYEACFSPNDPSQHIFTLCSNGQPYQEGTGSASPYTAACSDLCFHGTHVASIAAGRSGVAPSSNIIAIQVFFKSDDPAICDPDNKGLPTPCIRSRASDQIDALQKVLELHTTYSIAAVNLSLGGGNYSGYCDTLANSITNGKVSYKAAIDMLYSVGVATIVASGNGNSTVGIVFPACISSAISVGATTYFDQIAAPFPDYVSYGSDSDNTLDLLAPGSHICAALPTYHSGEGSCTGGTNGHYGTLSGTSMAAPHVTGTWAVLKQRYPQATVDQILAVLQSSGKPVLDYRNNVTVTRIRIDNALHELPSPSWYIPSLLINRVSLRSDGSQAQSGNSSSHPSLSSDGRLVAFESWTNNLVSEDTNTYDDVFVYDRRSNLTTRISVASDGSQANFSSFDPSISNNGRFVAFASFANNLVGEDTNGSDDIFLHDLQTGLTTRVSLTSVGSQANSASERPSISGDGRFVAFVSWASNLDSISLDTNNKTDVFVFDGQTHQVKRISMALDGSQTNDNSDFPSISSDGRYVAFWSAASNLVANDTNGKPDIFIHDLWTGLTTRVSIASTGEQSNDSSERSSISSNGRFVAFVSWASNLVPGDTNNTSDIFVHDLQTGLTTRVSIGSDGTQANDVSEFPSISGNGRLIAFSSNASNLVLLGDTNSKYDIFVHDLQTGLTTRVSIPSRNSQADDTSRFPSMSENGLYVAFVSWASNLVANDTNSGDDEFIADLSYMLNTSSSSVTPPRNYFITSRPTLTWSRVSWAVWYELQVATNENFTGATTYSADNNLFFTFPFPLGARTYYWHVRACSSPTDCRSWSTTESFVVGAP